MSEQIESKDYIDLIEVCKKILSRKKLFFTTWCITFVVSCIVIFPVPRSYQSSLSVVPESQSAGAAGGLAALVGSMGINLNAGGSGGDAFFPDIYPDVISTNEFIVSLFDVPVETCDHELQTTYYDYIRNHNRRAYYSYPKVWLFQFIGWLTDDGQQGGGGGTINPNHLDKVTNGFVETIRDNISCSVDKKTGVITISVVDQDPVICARMADTIRVRLQKFITDYRTQKARTDMEYYATLMEDAKAKYLSDVEAFSTFCDQNVNMQLQSVITRKDFLHNEYTNSRDVYNGLLSQHRMAMAKVQEDTPAFTVLSRPNVPIKASKPKRVIFVLAMLILSSFGVVLHIFREEVMEQIRHMR